MSLSLLQSLGFLINWTKSTLSPVQSITYLGFVISSVNMTIYLSEAKVQRVYAVCNNSLSQPQNVRTTARQPPRNPGVLSPCHMGSPLAPKGSSNPAHTNPEEPPVRLQLSSISQSQVSSRANLVAKQFTQGQRQPCFPPTTGSHNSLKCFNARLGCHVSGQDH